MKYEKVEFRNKFLKTFASDIEEIFVIERLDNSGCEIVCAYIKPYPYTNMREFRKYLNKFADSQELYICFILVSNIPYNNIGNVDKEKLFALPVISNDLNEHIIKSMLKGEHDYQLNLTEYKLINNEEFHINDVIKIGNLISPNLLYKNQLDSCANIQSVNNFDKDLAILNGEEISTINYKANLIHALDTASTNVSSKIVFIDNEDTLITETYDSIIEKSKNYLFAMQQLGIKQKDVVIITLPSSMDFLLIFWACILGGIIPLPIPSIKESLKEDETISTIIDLEAQLTTAFVLTDSTGFLILTEQYLGKFKYLSVHDFNDYRGIPKLIQINPSDTALMLLTSGSTGKPKVVVHSHQSISSRSVATIKHNNFTAKDISLNWFAFDHVGALVMFHIRDVFLGCTQIHIKTSHILENPLRWLKYIDLYKVTITWAPSFAFNLAVNEIKSCEYNLSSLKFILNGGEKIDVEAMDKFLSKFSVNSLPLDSMHPSWGMSETCSGVVYSTYVYGNNTLHDAVIGYPIPGCSIRIVDEQNKLLNKNSIGKLQITGSTIMKGYLNDINNKFSSFTIDGWFDTGDLAKIDEKKGLIIVGRDKNIIIINGKKYSCKSIEDFLNSNDYIAFGCACVIPIKDNVVNLESLIVFIALKDMNNVEPLLSQIKIDITKFVGVSPKYIIVLNDYEFPKTTIGKIKKSLLQQNFIEGKYLDQIKFYDCIFSLDNLFPDWFYEPIWFKKSKNYSINDMNQTILICVNKEYSGKSNDTLLDTLSNLYSDSYTIYHGDKFSCCGKSYSANLNNPGDIVNIFYDLDNNTKVIDQIIYVNYKVFDINDKESGKKIQSHLESIIYLCQNLLKFNKNSIKFVYLDVANSMITESCFAAPIIALLKSLSSENKRFKYKYIAIDINDNHINKQNLLSEIDDNQDKEIIFNNQNRYVQGIRKIKIPCLMNKTPIFKISGLGVVVGGMGAIGHEIAKLLVKEYNINLIILGRHDLRDILDGQKKLDILKINNKVSYEKIDILNEEYITKYLNEYLNINGGSLDFIINCAGVFEFQRDFNNITRSDILNLTDSKISGTINLLKISQRFSTKLINFSSVNGYFGGVHSQLYSSATAFQDVLAKIYPEVITLSWSMWNKFGMSKDINSGELTKLNGFSLIEPLQGCASFLIAMSTQSKNILIGLDANYRNINTHDNYSIINLEHIEIETNTQIENLKIKDIFGNELHVDTKIKEVSEINANSNIGLDRQAKIDILLDIWKHILDLREINLDDNFFDLGGHSLLVPKLITLIKNGLSLNVTAVEIFSYPTINLFVEKFLPTIKQELSFENIVIDIRKIWMEKLNLDTLSNDENFFDLGANSLMIPSVQAVINNKFNIKLNIVDLFRYPTLSSLSKLIFEILNNKSNIMEPLIVKKEKNLLHKRTRLEKNQ